MNNDLKHNPKRNSVLLCCGGKACPEIYAKGKHNVQIRDDSGFIITITREQAKLISDAVDIIEHNETE